MLLGIARCRRTPASLHSRGAHPRTRQLRAPRTPPGPHGRPRTHLLSAATVPASSNRQSWRLRASSRALGPGSCFQSSRSPLLRAMGAAGRGDEGAGVPVQKQLPSRRAHGAELLRPPGPGPGPGPGRFSQGGGPGGRPCPAAALRSPRQASECLRGGGAQRRAKEAERPPRADPPLRPPPRGAPAAAGGEGATFPFAFRPSLPSRGKLSRVNFVPPLRGSGSSSSGTGRSRRRGAAPALPAGEGRSGGRARTRPCCGPRPGPAVPGSAVPLPTPEGGEGRRRAAGTAGDPAAELRRRSCSRGEAALLPASCGSGRPAPRPAGRELPSGLLSHCALSRGIKSFRERHNARVLLLQGSHHNSLLSLCRFSAFFSPEFTQEEWIEEIGTGTPVCSDERKTRCNL